MSFGCPQGDLIQWSTRKLPKLSYHLHFPVFASVIFQHWLKFEVKKEKDTLALMMKCELLDVFWCLASGWIDLESRHSRRFNKWNSLSAFTASVAWNCRAKIFRFLWCGAELKRLRSTASHGLWLLDLKKLLNFFLICHMRSFICHITLTENTYLRMTENI